ncbi:hypothetical protein ABZ646_38210, partial [Streptomyces sp. NPDC007162]
MSAVETTVAARSGRAVPRPPRAFFLLHTSALIPAPDDVHEALPGPYDLVLHFACPASPADYLRHPLETLDAGSLGTRT